MSYVFTVISSEVVQANHFQMSTILTAATVYPDEQSIIDFVEDGLRQGEIECEGIDPQIEKVEILGEMDDDLRLLVKVYIVSDYQSP